MDDLVRGGFAEASPATTDSGYKAYDRGRYVLRAATNYITNPSFETESATPGKAAGWTLADNVSGDPTYTLPAGRVGGLCQRIQHTSAGDSSKYINTYFRTAAASFAAGEYATFSFYAKGSVNGCSFICAIDAENNVPSWLATSTEVPVALTSSWQRYSVTYGPLPATTDHVVGIIRSANIDNGDTIDICIDDACLTKDTFVAPYFSGPQSWDVMSGCAWAGAPNASASTRAASQCFIPMTLGTSGTFAFRFRTLWAGNDGATHRLIESGVGTTDVLLRKLSNGAWDWKANGSGAIEVQSPAASFAAGLWHTAVCRWTPTQIDLCIDGVDYTQAGGPCATVNPGLWVGGNDGSADCEIGPTIASPQVKSDAWKNALIAGNGAALESLDNLFRFSSRDDYMVPLFGDSRAHRKLGGGSVPFELVPYNGTAYTTGNSYGADDGVISLRFDDFGSRDYTYVYPALGARGLAGGFAMMGASATGTTLTHALEMQAAGHEIMCHSQTHPPDPSGYEAFRAETADAARGMRALGLNIASFVQPGTWVGRYNIWQDVFYKSAEHQLLAETFSAYEAYMDSLGVTRTLPVTGLGRYGAGHTTGDSLTLQQLKDIVDACIAAQVGRELLFHSDAIGGAGTISEANFEAFLDYVASKVAAGTLTVLTPTQQLFANVAT